MQISLLSQGIIIQVSVIVISVLVSSHPNHFLKEVLLIVAIVFFCPVHF